MTAYIGTYGLYVDWDNDGDFSDTYDDVTIDVMGPVRTSQGFASPGDRVAQVGWMEFSLDNSGFNQHGEAGLYSPSNAASSLAGKLQLGRPVKLTVTEGATTTTLFTGYIARIVPAPSGQTARVKAYDEMVRIQRAKVALPVQVNKRTDEVIEALLDAIGAFSTDLDTGKQVLAHAGDTWSGEISAYSAIRDVCTAEWGRLWAEPDGTIRFWNIHTPFTNPTTSAVFDGTMVGLDLDYDDRSVVNRVIVETTPRKTGSSGTVLATLQDQPSIGPGETKLFHLQFRDPDGSAEIGALTVDALVAGTDYTPTTGLTVSMTASASKAEVTVENTDARKRTITLTKLQVRGTPLYTYDTVGVVAEDTTSQAMHGRRDERHTLRVGGNPQFAEYLANHILGQFTEPVVFVRSLSLTNLSSAVYEAQRTLTLMDVIEVSEDTTGIDEKRYRIVAIEHTINGALHRTTYRLEPHNWPDYALWDEGKWDKALWAPF